MLEMSPLFTAYCNNIHTSCKLVYDWLQQDLDGILLRDRLSAALQDNIDLIHSQYGELELLANFRQLILGESWQGSYFTSTTAYSLPAPSQSKTTVRSGSSATFG